MLECRTRGPELSAGIGHRLLLGAAGAILSSLACLPAHAHPHLLISFETTVLYEKGTFVGLQHAWTFDEMNSIAEIEGLDKNNDGVYTRAELQELADTYAQRLKGASFFTDLKLEGKSLQLAAAKDQWVEYKNNAITLHFTVPFAAPVLTEAKGLTFSVSDPTYYIAFTLAEKADAVRLGDGTPANCKARVGELASAAPQPPSGLQESFAAFSSFGISAPKTVSVECGGQ
jgi:ABC-type uncharacterized transport system substrate-binding protein